MRIIPSAKFVPALSLLVLLAFQPAADARSFSEFLQAVGRSIVHPQHRASRSRAVSPPQPSRLWGNLPYGIPVPKKPGFVKSPFSPDRGLIDVRRFPRGTEVKDPYSDKIFLAP